MKKITLIVFAAVLLSSCINQHQEQVTTCYEIAKKHMEQESYNNHGAFNTEHYFLMTDGTLKNVTLKDYIDCEVGDSVCWTETYWVEDETSK